MRRAEMPRSCARSRSIETRSSGLSNLRLTSTKVKGRVRRRGGEERRQDLLQLLHVRRLDHELDRQTPAPADGDGRRLRDEGLRVGQPADLRRQCVGDFTLSPLTLVGLDQADPAEARVDRRSGAETRRGDRDRVVGLGNLLGE